MLSILISYLSYLNDLLHQSRLHHAVTLILIKANSRVLYCAVMLTMIQVNSYNCVNNASLSVHPN